MSAMISALHRWQAAGVLRPLDLAFADWIGRLAPTGEPELLLSAALAAHRAGQGDSCLSLARFAGRPAFDWPADREGAPPPVLRCPALDDWTALLQQVDVVGSRDDNAPLILDGERLYIGRYYDDERTIAEAVSSRAARLSLESTGVAETLSKLFGRPGEDAVDWQRVAAATAVYHRFAVISGGPGTGKTTTLVKVLAMLLHAEPELTIHLVAPTGKAADRMLKVIRERVAGLGLSAEILARMPKEAETIHRYLRPDRLGRFQRNATNKAPTDCVVVDEASMVDLQLMAALVRSLPAAARLILLGDRFQLASVDAGSVLGDLCGHGQTLSPSPDWAAQLEAVGAIGAGMVPAGEDPAGLADCIAELKVSHRFDARSGIGKLAAWVNASAPESDSVEALFRRFEDLELHLSSERGPAPEALEVAIEHYAAIALAGSAEDALAKIDAMRVLCAVRRGPFGVEAVNAAIEQALRERGVLAPLQGASHYPGRPILITSNDYGLRLYNGDVGVIWPNDEGQPRAWFRTAEGDGLRALSPYHLPEHETVFAMTIHKSQGSEFDRVLLILADQDRPYLSRELIYTAITRARRRLLLSAGSTVLQEAAGRAVQRDSGLADRLGWTG